MKDKIGEKKLKRFLKTLNQYDFSLPLLEIMYQERQEFSVTDLSERLEESYQNVHRFLSRLKSLGFIRGKKKLHLSQVGLEISKNCLSLGLDEEFIEIFSRKHASEILAFLEEERGWKEIKSEVKIGSSSIKHILDLLLERDVVEKVGKGYGITEKGEELLGKYRELSRTKILPKYEIQVKIKGIKSIPEKIKDSYGLKEVKNVTQEDRYIRKGFSHSFSDNYLRLRKEQPQDSSLSSFATFRLSWANTLASEERDGLKLLEREKETIETKYPEIIFFFNYFDARVEMEIVKKRKVYKTSDGVVINLDRIVQPEENFFVEFKATTKNKDEAELQIGNIKKLIDECGFGDKEATTKTYAQIFGKK